MGGFLDKLRVCAERNDSLLCVGLDPEPDLLPAGYSRDAQGVAAFNRTVIEATRDLVCAYKPNFAFYEALGTEGLRALEHTLEHIPPCVPTIADAKRGDVPNTARLYARAVFGAFGFDSVTVSPYMGADSLEPFLAWAGRGVWVLCRTSNSGAADVQDLAVGGQETAPVYERVVRMIDGIGGRADTGLVVGATAPRELDAIRALSPAVPLLIPGIGAQGGALNAAVRASRSGPVVINSARSVLYCETDAGVEGGIRRRALALRDRINALRV